MKRRPIIALGWGILLAGLAACSGAAPSARDVEIPVAALSPLSLEWILMEVGSGIKPAFAVDSQGAAHVAFLTEEDHGGVFYASNATGAFVVETVAEGYFYGPVDLALGPDDTPFIAYHDHQELEFMPELGDAVVASLQNGSWALTVVRDEGHDGWDNSIVVGSDGSWHAVGVDPAQFGSEVGVEYATNADGAVRVEPVGSGPTDYEFATSVALDARGAPAVAYYDSKERQLELARRGDSGWAIEVVDDQGDAGRYPALAFAPDGGPHIVYFVADGQNAGTIRHAWQEGQVWRYETIDRLEEVRTGRVGARKLVALAFDADGRMHIAYTDRSRLVYGRRTEAGWAVQEVVTGADRPLGQLVELAVDSAGRPHLLWFQPTSFSPVLQGTVIYAAGP